MKMKEKKGILTMLIILILLVLIIAVVLFKESGILSKINIKYNKIKEELIDLKISIVNENEKNYDCLLVFKSNNSEDKIKRIIYPDIDENGNHFVINVNERETVGIDYKFEKENNKQKTFIVETKNGNIVNKDTLINLYGLEQNEKYEIETHMIVNAPQKIKVSNIVPEKENYHFIGWSAIEGEKSVPSYIDNGLIEYKGENIKNALYPIWVETKSGYKEKLNNDSLLGRISEINNSGIQTLEVNGESYSSNVIVIEKDVILNGINEVEGAILSNSIYEFGNKTTDVGTASSNAENSVIVKINGNLTITPGITVTACKSDNGYGGPKGLYIYCTGAFSNNGITSMTARGAKALGQDIYLWKNINGEFEYIPSIGAKGGTAGYNGSNGTYRRTGGGGAGGSYYGDTTIGGTGGTGTSYSGRNRRRRSLGVLCNRRNRFINRRSRRKRNWKV